MSTKPPRRVPKETAATPAEIEAAIEALTPADLAKLKRYAENRIWKLGPKADSRTADDLFQIAVDSLLNDTRRDWFQISPQPLQRQYVASVMDLLVVDTWSDRQTGHRGFSGAAKRSARAPGIMGNLMAFGLQLPATLA